MPNQKRIHSRHALGKTTSGREQGVAIRSMMLCCFHPDSNIFQPYPSTSQVAEKPISQLFSAAIFKPNMLSLAVNCSEFHLTEQRFVSIKSGKIIDDQL